MSHRERKVVGAVACPTCGAPIGRPCRVTRGRPMVCDARRQAWQAWRAQHPADYLLTAAPRDEAPSRDSYWMRLAPQSRVARDALTELERSGLLAGAVRDPALGIYYVPQPAVSPLTRRLIVDGWIVGEDR